MFEILKNKPSIVREAQNARIHKNFIIQLLIFIAVFIVTQIAAAIPLVVVIIIKLFKDVSGGVIDPQDPDSFSRSYMDELGSAMTLPLLFCTVIVTLMVIVYCKYIEKRSLYSMGFVGNKAVKDYFTGLLTGFAMFGTCVLIAAITGTLEFNGVILGNSLGLIIVFLLGFAFQGMSEEVMLRGYFMVSIASKKPVLLAVMANSILFALMHLLNNGITALAVFNLILFGVFASVYTLKMNSIWGICALHSMWNFAQGNIFGIPVSGMDIKASVLSFVPTEGGTLINGGLFGLEGGLAVTIVLLISTAAVMFIKGRSPQEDVSEAV